MNEETVLNGKWIDHTTMRAFNSGQIAGLRSLFRTEPTIIDIQDILETPDPRTRLIKKKEFVEEKLMAVTDSSGNRDYQRIKIVDLASKFYLKEGTISSECRENFDLPLDSIILAYVPAILRAMDAIQFTKHSRLERRRFVSMGSVQSDCDYLDLQSLFRVFSENRTFELEHFLYQEGKKLPSIVESFRANSVADWMN